MKTILKTSFLAIALLIGIVANAQEKPVTFGVKGGVNLSNFSGSGVDGSDAKIGFNVGVTVDYALTPDFFLLSGLEFTTKGAKDEGSFSLDGVSFKGKEKSNPMYLQIPIHAGYRLAIAENTNIAFHAGPYLAYGVGGKIKYEGVGSVGGDALMDIDTDIDFFGEGRFKRFDFGLGLGVDLELSKFVVGLGYDLGLINILDNKDYKVRNMNAYLTVGYKF